MNNQQKTVIESDRMTEAQARFIAAGEAEYMAYRRGPGAEAGWGVWSERTQDWLFVHCIDDAAFVRYCSAYFAADADDLQPVRV